MQCNDCNNIFEALTKVSTGYKVCESCLTEYKKCANCEAYVSTKMVETRNNEDVCRFCIENYYTSCGNCEEYFLKSEMRATRTNDYVCESCIYKYYTSCNNCQDLYDQNDERMQNEVCDNCYYENGGEKRMIVSPELLEYTKGNILHDKRLFGIELEVMIPSKNYRNFYSKVPKEILLVEDSSISGDLGTAIELVSPPLCGKKGEEMVKKMGKILYESNARIDKSCGYHLHLDGSDLMGLSKPQFDRSIFQRTSRPDVEKLKKVFSIYLAFDKLLLGMIPSSRKTGNTYCKVFRKEYALSSLWKVKTPEDFDSWVYKTRDRYDVDHSKNDKYTNERYSGINVHSLLYRGTIEIRYHSATINPTKILMWVDFNQKIIHNALTQNIPQNKIRAISRLSKTNTLLKELLTFINENNTPLSSYIEKRLLEFN